MATNGLDRTGNRVQESEDNPSCKTKDERDTLNKHGRNRWKERFVSWFCRWMEKTRNSNLRHAHTIRRGWAATLFLASAIALYKRGRRLRSRSIGWPVLLAMFYRADYESAVDASLSLLQSMARTGQIGRALVGPSQIFFQDSEGSWKRSILPKNSPALQSELMDLLCHGGCKEVSALPETLWSRIGPAILTALPFVYLALMYKILKSTNGNDMSSKLLDSDRQRTRFTDIAGLDPVIVEVKEIVNYLQDPKRYNALGAKPPRGVLLHGLPGSGKTLLAQAIAGEADCDAFIACCGSDFCEMYVGRGSARVRQVFKEARSTAKRRQFTFSWIPWKTTTFKRPATAIIFIDELDALAKSRSYNAVTSNDERDQTLNALLTEIDGFPSQEEEDKVITIVIAATNRSDVLDPAIVRRFDRRINIAYPDRVGRRDIMKIHARRTACCLDEIDWDVLASDELTGGFSGSDLRGLVNDAALLAVRENCSTISQSHYHHAIRRMRAMKNSASPSSTNHAPAIWIPGSRA